MATAHRRALIAALTVLAALLPISALAGAGPAIVGFSPQEGSIRGGTVVHISGGGFEGATGVDFGGHPASSFEVRSANLIDAVAPALTHGANTRIVVSTASGAATSNRDFTFIGCHVPQLRHDRVARAHKELLAAGCKVGRIERARGAHRPLRVVAETPHVGLWLEPGARVALHVR